MSPERKPIPHRILSIAFDRNERQAVFDAIARFAEAYGFAARISSDSLHPGEPLLQLYRSDMKMVGATHEAPSRLDIAIYKTPRDGTPLWAIDQAVAGLRQRVAPIRGVSVSQQTPTRVDAPETFIDSFPSLRSLNITLAERTQRDALAEQLQAFANQNRFAILISKTKPDPNDLAVFMFRDDAMIIGSMPFAIGELSLRFYAGRFPDGEHIMPPDQLDLLTNDLKQTLARIPGAIVQ